ncbi:sulfotransferase family protein [Streptomyces roseifaciens]|uniref:sulfotransferase family protein n=1 Tax=Streptomyces roseifaciens TaxID=1488406 RepID=UPI00071822A4|nr:sulfotransferase [Streptomyces roseifaciens]
MPEPSLVPEPAPVPEPHPAPEPAPVPPSVSVPEPTLVFLLGITKRSGTNFLFDLLREHPDIEMRPPLWEDYVLERIGPVADFAAGLTGLWRDWWDMDQSEADRFVRAIGAGIESYLTEDATTRFVLLKTPTPANLHLAPLLFPRSPLILLVRDGRQVVDSARLSFGTGEEETTWRWADGGRQILGFLADAGQSREPGPARLLVRYEDLVADTETQLRRVFGALGADPETYDYARAANLPVRGSSVVRGGARQVHWEPVARPEDFDPLTHHPAWEPERLAAFAAVAGDVLEAFGYPPLNEPPGRARGAHRISS